MTEATIRPTRFEVSLLPEDDINRRYFALYVEWRGADQWAITNGFHECMDPDGEWSYESIPSERADDWLATHRFDLETAQRLAVEAAPRINVNGMTAAQVLARKEAP